jgi:hypothetical protein
MSKDDLVLYATAAAYAVFVGALGGFFAAMITWLLMLPAHR